jgi:hypothetical protein
MQKMSIPFGTPMRGNDTLRFLERKRVVLVSTRTIPQGRSQELIGRASEVVLDTGRGVVTEEDQTV